MRRGLGWVTIAVMLFVGRGSLLLSSGVGSAPANEVRKVASAPTFYKDVVPILQDKCQSCHRSGEAAPMALVSYEQTRPWAGKMTAAVEMKMMPPWFADPRYGHFVNDSSLSDGQIATIAAWAKAGAPAGDARDSPPLRIWSEGWNIPQPDVVVRMPRPVQI